MIHTNLLVLKETTNGSVRAVTDIIYSASIKEIYYENVPQCELFRYFFKI